MLPTANACLGRQTAIAYMIHLTEHGRAGGSARSSGVSRGTAFDGQRRRAAAVGPQGGGKVIDFAFRLGLSYGLKEIRLTVVSVCDSNPVYCGPIPLQRLHAL